jgi:hypothetical protein
MQKQFPEYLNTWNSHRDGKRKGHAALAHRVMRDYRLGKWRALEGIDTELFQIGFTLQYYKNCYERNDSLAGESNLGKLMISLSPCLMDGDFVFCSIEGAKYGDFSELFPIASFCEDEGLTLLVRKENARKSRH